VNCPPGAAASPAPPSVGVELVGVATLHAGVEALDLARVTLDVAAGRELGPQANDPVSVVHVGRHDGRLRLQRDEVEVGAPLAVLPRVPSGASTNCSGPSASRSARADATTQLALRLRSTAMPPSQHISGPKGGRKSAALSIPYRFRSKAKPAISVNGTLQLPSMRFNTSTMMEPSPNT
jgi:hypothetical protein